MNLCLHSQWAGVPPGAWWPTRAGGRPSRDRMKSLRGETLPLDPPDWVHNASHTGSMSSASCTRCEAGEYSTASGKSSSSSISSMKRHTDTLVWFVIQHDET